MSGVLATEPDLVPERQSKNARMAEAVCEQSHRCRHAIETQSGGSFSRLILILCCASMVIEGYDVQVLAYAVSTPGATPVLPRQQIQGGGVLGSLIVGRLMNGISTRARFYRAHRIHLDQAE